MTLRSAVMGPNRQAEGDRHRDKHLFEGGAKMDYNYAGNRLRRRKEKRGRTKKRLMEGVESFKCAFYCNIYIYIYFVLRLW